MVVSASLPGWNFTYLIRYQLAIVVLTLMEYSCFNSEFSNGIFQPKEDQESFNMKEKGKGKKNEAKLCCCTKNTKNASLNFFFFPS